MSHSKYKKLSVNSLLPTIFLLILLPLIPHFSFMKKQQQRNGIMWIITFPNKQYFFSSLSSFYFPCCCILCWCSGASVSWWLWNKCVKEDGKGKKIEMEKKRKEKNFVPFLSSRNTFFFVLLFRSHTLVYLLRFFFSLTQHSHTTPHHLESFSRPRSLHFFFFFP